MNGVMAEDDLENLVADILAEARAQGASAAEVAASIDTGLAVTVRRGELETIEFNQDRGFGITVYFGQRKGSASTSDSSRGAIAETVRAAANIARFTEEDPCNGLADPGLMPARLPDLDLHHPWELDPLDAEAMARECEAAGLDVTGITNSEGAQVSTQRSHRVYGNSHGFIGSHRGTRHGLSCSLIAEDANGMQRDYWYTVARAPGELQAAAEVGAETARRTVARLSPRRVRTGRFPVLFAPTVASGLIGHLLGAISGGAQYRHSTFLQGALGHAVTSSHLTLREEPHQLRGPGSAAFDGDGVATRAKAFVSGGVLEHYVLSSYSGRKLNLPTTANAGGVHNLTISGTTRSVAELLADMGTGLLVTELMGQGVNPVTGDYSRGASGFWVENGAIAYPVHELTIAGNLKEMLLDIPYIGDDPDLRGNIRAPSLLVGRMTLAGD